MIPSLDIMVYEPKRVTDIKLRTPNIDELKGLSIVSHASVPFFFTI